MTKSTFIAILLCLIPFAGKAQAVINGESFESTTFPPAGWSQTSTSINRWTRVNTSTFPTVSIAPFGIAFARFQARGVTAGTTQTIALPPMDFRLRGSNTPKVRFLMYRDSLSKNADSISLYANTSNSLTGATLLGQVARYSRLSVPDTQIKNGWYPYVFSVPASFNGAVNYIMVKAISQAGYNIYLDSFRWETYPKQCNGKPTGTSLSANPAVICGGTGTSALSISGSSSTDFGVSVVWQFATTKTGPWTNTGATGVSTTTGTITASRYYRCLLTCSLSGLSDTTAPLLVTVVTTPKPVLTVTPNTANFCSGGQPVQLVVTGAKTYTWTPTLGLNVANKDTVLASPASSTNYLVTGTDSNGCTGTSFAAITLRQPSAVTVVAADTLMCAGDSLRLQAQTGGALSYLWSPGGQTTNTIYAKPTANARYTVTIKNNFNCSSSAGINLTVANAPIAAAAYSQKGLTFSFKDGSSNAKSVHWFFGDGNESTKSNPTYTYSYDSTYEVMLVAYNPPCGNDTLRLIVNNPLFAKKVGSTGVLVLSPNPATDAVLLSGITTDDQINVVNISGQQVLSVAARNGVVQGKLQLDLRHLTPGTYSISVTGKHLTRRAVLVKTNL